MTENVGMVVLATSQSEAIANSSKRPILIVSKTFVGRLVPSLTRLTPHLHGNRRSGGNIHLIIPFHFVDQR
jgi:hypothetical protein